MVQILPKENDWSDVGRNLAGGFVQGYQNRSDDMAIQKAISDLGENPPPDKLLKAILGTKTHNPESKKTAFTNYLGVENMKEVQRHAMETEKISREKEQQDIKEKQAKEEKELVKQNEERQKTRNIVNQIEDITPEQKEQFGESLTLGTAEDLLKNQIKGGSKNTKFEDKRATKYAEEYVKLEDEIPKLENTIEDIGYARKLSDDLGYSGTAASVVGLSGIGKELEGVTFPLIEQVVKTFNPSGPIAQQKLKLIQDKYAVKATDFPWIKKAKLDALERYALQALDRKKKKQALIKQYNGLPPQAAIERFDKESDTLVDSMQDYDLTGEEVKDVPVDAKKFKGKTVTGPDGIKYRSDGTRWVKA